MGADHSEGVTMRMRRFVPYVALAALILVLALNNAAVPFRSSEVAFTDSSAHGMSIVPASCPSYPHYAGDCSSAVCPDGTPVPASGLCPTGQPKTCPDGSPVPSNGVCFSAPHTCPDGSAMPPNGICGSGGICPDGSAMPSNGVCSTGAICTPTATCKDSTTIHYRDSACRQGDVACPQYWSCAAGACVPPPSIDYQSFSAISPTGQRFTASGQLEAHPTLVRSGNSTTLYWNVANVSSCTISSTKGDLWSCGGPQCSSGMNGWIPKPILSATTYTLACSALPGATPSTVVESVKVNVAPTFKEI